MNNLMMAEALRALAGSVDLIRDNLERDDSDQLSDASEVIRVFARVLEGRPIEKAFGAPGDWGYETSIGRSLTAKPFDI